MENKNLDLAKLIAEQPFKIAFKATLGVMVAQSLIPTVFLGVLFVVGYILFA